MPTPTTEIQVISSKAWISLIPPVQTPGGQLIVSLDYNSNDHRIHHLVPAVPQGINPRILLLDLKPSTELMYIFNPRHASYSTGLTEMNQFDSIEIIYFGKMVATITDIPVVQ